jgi:DnaK suppressor protein
MAQTSNDNASGLTVEQLESLRQQLLRQRESLLARLTNEQSVVREGEQLIEPLEVAEQTREQDDAVRFAERDRPLLEEIDHALAKFATGQYGLSETSDEPIGLRRLQAVPWARYTTDEEDEHPQVARPRDERDDPE